MCDDTKDETSAGTAAGTAAGEEKAEVGAAEVTGAADAHPCPHCGRWALKDDRCNWVCCGLETHGTFRAGQGCGRQWCFRCGLKLCTRVYDEEGTRIAGARTDHDASCCAAEATADTVDGWCPGGHHSHCAARDLSAQFAPA